MPLPLCPAATVHHPDGKRLRRCRAAAWFPRETALRLLSIENSQHKLRPVPDELRGRPAAESRLAGIPSRLPGIDARRSSCGLEPGEFGWNWDQQLSLRRATAARASHSPDSSKRAGPDHLASSLMPPAGWKLPPKPAPFESAQSREPPPL